jgi:alkylhydroperoxidase family enzyme
MESLVVPRIAPLEPPYAPDVKAAFDAIMKGSDPLILFRTMAISERAWRKFREGSLLDRGPLSLREREIVIDRTTALANCEYEWGAHIEIFAKAVKFTDEQIAATKNGDANSACWSEAERALIAAVDALHEHATLSTAEFDGLRIHYNDEKILEILLLCGRYRTISYLANALDLPLEPTAARFPPRP